MTNMANANQLIYDIASIIHDDSSKAPILIEELVKMLSDDQLNQIEDVIVNQFGYEETSPKIGLTYS